MNFAGATLYPARSTAASRWLTDTVDRARTVARSVARFTEAAITPGTFNSAVSTRLAHEAQVMPSIWRAVSLVSTS